MLESLRIWPHIRARILSGPLGPHIDDYVSWLEGAGYSRYGIRRHIQAADCFGVWLAARSPDDRPARGIELWLWSYDAHLRQVHGLCEGTRRRYLRFARRFVEAHFGAAEPAWSSVTADDITEFVRLQAGRLKASACRGPVTAIRAMLRFLVTSGAVLPGLASAVPTVRQWKLATLPRHLADDQLERVLDHCDGETAIGLRDRAVLLLLARLGLRSAEVAHLTLDDVDWCNGQVRIGAGKTGAERSLPFPEEVGGALVAYLRSRGTVDGLRSVFLCAGPPGRRPLTAAAVGDIAKRALRRAGVAVKAPGAHIFRHTAATQMVRRGATFKQVADVLGHALIETTTIYAKLDVDTLARVALPWPGPEGIDE